MYCFINLDVKLERENVNGAEVADSHCVNETNFHFLVQEHRPQICLVAGFCPAQFVHPERVCLMYPSLYLPSTELLKSFRADL